MIFAREARKKALDTLKVTSFNNVALAIQNASSNGSFSVTVSVEWSDDLGLLLTSMGYSYNYNKFANTITIDW